MTFLESLERNKPESIHGYGFVDLTGQCFERLTVIKFSGTDKNQRSRWLCKCLCGNEKIVGINSLKQGHTKSCGCLNKEKRTLWGINNTYRRKEKGRSGFNQLLNMYKKNANRRKLEFNISESEFLNLVQSNCFYCGKKPTNISYNHFKSSTEKAIEHGKFIYNGLDRLDNNIGYTIDNVVPCCKTCNTAKMQMTQQEFFDWIKQVYEYFIKGKEND
jgi:hypothetical protein